MTQQSKLTCKIDKKLLLLCLGRKNDPRDRADESVRQLQERVHILVANSIVELYFAAESHGGKRWLRDGDGLRNGIAQGVGRQDVEHRVGERAGFVLTGV